MLKVRYADCGTFPWHCLCFLHLYFGWSVVTVGTHLLMPTQGSLSLLFSFSQHTNPCFPFLTYFDYFLISSFILFVIHRVSSSEATERILQKPRSYELCRRVVSYVEAMLRGNLQKTRLQGVFHEHLVWPLRLRPSKGLCASLQVRARLAHESLQLLCCVTIKLSLLPLAARVLFVVCTIIGTGVEAVELVPVPF